MKQIVGRARIGNANSRVLALILLNYSYRGPKLSVKHVSKNVLISMSYGWKNVVLVQMFVKCKCLRYYLFAQFSRSASD